VTESESGGAVAVTATADFMTANLLAHYAAVFRAVIALHARTPCRLTPFDFKGAGARFWNAMTCT